MVDLPHIYFLLHASYHNVVAISSIHHSLLTPPLDIHSVGVNRMQFLLESLRDLDSSLRQRGSRLLVLKGTPQQVLPQVFKVWYRQLCH